MRERTPDFATKSLLRVFVFQGALTALIALPLLFAQAGERPEGLLWTDVLFLALFAIGFTFEAVADWQLTRFKADPGKPWTGFEHRPLALFAASQLLR